MYRMLNSSRRVEEEKYVVEAFWNVDVIDDWEETMKNLTTPEQ